ncbi:MAG: XdhC family protein, partial [Pseudomonadales bacterium]|nr:XdhC family protein [Pseudomonadales bacterium]
MATVIGTWGSSPRPVGSLLACDENGHLTGSLSGGCVEDDLLEKLTRGELAADLAQFFTYGVNDEEAEKFGLPCGGTLRIIIEPLGSQADAGNQFRQLSEALLARRHMRRLVDLRNQTTRLETADGFTPLFWDEEKQQLRHTYGPRHQLFIIGAGMVSRYLAEMARSLDYAITVCDPRQQMLEDFGVAGVRLVSDMPDDAIRAGASDPGTAIVALTHDPRIDDMGLMEALKTEAFYVGALGSSRTSASRRTRLKELDLTDTEIARLHAPVGLPIGSKTPPEIAISILAEITAVRAGVHEAARAGAEAAIAS